MLVCSGRLQLPQVAAQEHTLDALMRKSVGRLPPRRLSFENDHATRWITEERFASTNCKN
jgi:hypothetical protein